MWLVRPGISLTTRQWTSSCGGGRHTKEVVAGLQRRHCCSGTSSSSSYQLRSASSAQPAAQHTSRIRCSTERSAGAGAKPVSGRELCRWATSGGRRYRSTRPGARGEEQERGALLRRMARYIEEDPDAADKLGRVVSASGRLIRKQRPVAGLLCRVRERACEEKEP